jgi:hypothetical protein
MLPPTQVKQMEGDVRHGRVFRIERRDTDYLVQSVMGAAIYPCEGWGRDPDAEAMDIQLRIVSPLKRSVGSGAGWSLQGGEPLIAQSVPSNNRGPAAAAARAPAIQSEAGRQRG